MGLATSVGGDESRASHEGFADVAEVVEEGPRTGEEHADATSLYLDSGGDFDQSHPPRTSMTFTKRIGFATAVEVTTASTAGTRFHRDGIFVKIVAAAFFRGWIGNRLS